MIEPCCDGCIYFRADSAEFAVDLMVGKAEDGQSVCVQHACASLVVGHAFRREVLGAVKLDDETCLVTVEVGDVSIYGLLPLEAGLIVTQEVVPEVILLGVAFFRRDLAKGMRFLLYSRDMLIPPH